MEGKGNSLQFLPKQTRWPLQSALLLSIFCSLMGPTEKHRHQEGEFLPLFPWQLSVLLPPVAAPPVERIICYLSLECTRKKKREVGKEGLKKRKRRGELEEEEGGKEQR